MKKLTEKDVEFDIIAEVDHLEVRGNALASGDENLDKETEDKILARLENGDVWAWAHVTVVARWEGFEGKDMLGACSYKNEADFMKGGYYDDMKQIALDDLNANLEAVCKKLHKVGC